MIIIRSWSPPGYFIAPRFYDSWSQVAETTFSLVGHIADQWVGYNGPTIRLVLLIGVRDGWPGAVEALAYLNPFLKEIPHQEGLPDLAIRGGWVIEI